jgi:hypothetical protein
MASGVLPWAAAITHRVQAAEAPGLFAGFHQGNRDKVLGAVIRWS